MKSVLRYAFFPYYVLSVTLAIYALNEGISRVTVLLCLLASTLTFSFIVEHLIPFIELKEGKLYMRDLFMVFVNIALTAIVGDFLMLMVLVKSSDFFLPFGIFKSLGQTPVIVQVTFAFLIAELVRYKTHYWQHKIPWLWKLHSVHHSIGKVYSLNNYYTHPVDYVLRNVLAFPLLAILGFSYETISIVAVLSTVGMFAHSGADFKLGFFNYVFSTNQTHRWHHSAFQKETDTNFGASLMIWDQVFGTYFNPQDRQSPEQYGLYPTLKK